MRVHLIRRHLPRAWAHFSQVAVVAMIVAVILLFGVQRAQADTTVAFLEVRKEAGYVASRVYAGRTVAGRAAEMGFRHSGEVAEVRVDIGDRVTRGTLLARLDDADAAARLSEAQAEVAVAEANMAALEAETELARQTEARFRELRGSGHVSAQAYDEQRLSLTAKEANLGVARASLLRAEAALAAARVALDQTRIHAPFDATVQARYLDEGTQAGPGSRVLRLVELGHTEAHVGVPESVLARLDETGTHGVRWQSQRYPARLRAVLPEVDAETRTLTAVFQLESDAIPLGAVVELELQSRIEAAGYWLPVTALTESDRGLWAVFVIEDGGLLTRRLVEILHAESDRAYVRGTLRDGEQVVRTGVQRLVPGQRVTPVTEWAQGS